MAHHARTNRAQRSLIGFEDISRHGPWFTAHVTAPRRGRILRGKRRKLRLLGETGQRDTRNLPGIVAQDYEPGWPAGLYVPGPARYPPTGFQGRRYGQSLLKLALAGILAAIDREAATQRYSGPVGPLFGKD